ncbi:MAG: AbrB/MazE/SpoVT family DNA-binding domain-containing protein [Firmicutes bacterium]|nr:AbrB/MazE/SpoVT family DNA-binding domain-containing protein [Bacillota bacterium]
MYEVKHKVISKNGSLTIPAAIRREYNNYLGGEAVDIKVEDGNLVITPHTPRCVFCGKTGDTKHEGKYICKICISTLFKKQYNIMLVTSEGYAGKQRLKEGESRG